MIVTAVEKDVLAGYESVRHRLPAGRSLETPTYKRRQSLAEIASPFAVIFLDAYGVINIGDDLILGVAEVVSDLRSAGKQVMVISNSAGYPKSKMLQRLARQGLDLSADQVVTSREAVLERLKFEPAHKWGLMIQDGADLEDFQSLNFGLLGDDPLVYKTADAFLLIGSEDWSEHRQNLLVEASIDRPRPVLVGNPDLYAPRNGFFSREPGYYGHHLADKTGVQPVFLGKPFPEIFNIAFDRITGSPSAEQILMVGDTLHTDILGGQAMGLSTALVTEYGGLQGMNVDEAVSRAGVMPDFVIPRI